MDSMTPQGGTPPMPMANNPLPQAANPPMPSAPPPPPMIEEGGSNGGAFIRSGGGIKEWFSDINIVDVTISAFIVGAVLYSVHYYKFMMMLEKSGYADLSAKIAKLQSGIDAQKAEMNATGSNKVDRLRKRPMMRLG